jgi:hypothetical protein
MANQRDIFNARIKSLMPEAAEVAEPVSEKSDLLAQDFLAKYGVTHEQASSLFRDGSTFRTMIEHMYQDTVDLLRECNIATEGPAYQAQAQLLNLFLYIPIQIEEINAAPTLGRQYSADPQGLGALNATGD